MKSAKVSPYRQTLGMYTALIITQSSLHLATESLWEVGIMPLFANEDLKPKETKGLDQGCKDCRRAGMRLVSPRLIFKRLDHAGPTGWPWTSRGSSGITHMQGLEKNLRKRASLSDAQLRCAWRISKGEKSCNAANSQYLKSRSQAPRYHEILTNREIFLYIFGLYLFSGVWTFTAQGFKLFPNHKGLKGFY